MNTTQTANSSKFLIAPIALIFIFGPIGADLYLPSLISISQYMTASIDMVQLSITFFMASMAISQIGYGILSDAYGRRPILINGLIFAIIGTIICLFSSSIYFFLFGRFIQGLGAGAGATVCRAIIRDLYTGHELIIMGSYIAITGIVFMICSPLIGSFAEHYINWQACFVVLFILGLINLFSIIFIIPETNIACNKTHIKLANILKNFSRLLESKVFSTYSITAALMYGGIFTWVTAGPVILNTIYDLNALQLGLCYFFSGCMYICGNLFNRHLVYKISMNTMIKLGLFIQLLSGFSLLITYILKNNNIFILLPAIGLYMFSASLVFTNTTAGSLNEFKEISGTASSLFSTIQTLGAIITSAIIAIISEKTLLPVSAIFICVSLLALSLNYYNKL